MEMVAGVLVLTLAGILAFVEGWSRGYSHGWDDGYASLLLGYALMLPVLRIVSKEAFSHGQIVGAFRFKEGKMKIYGGQE